MMVPVRCFTCGSVVGEHWEEFKERAREGDGEGTERQLENVVERIARIRERLEAARDGLPPGLANATDRRIEQAARRVEQAQNAETL